MKSTKNFVDWFIKFNQSPYLSPSQHPDFITGIENNAFALLYLKGRPDKRLNGVSCPVQYKNQDLEQKNEEILTQSERIIQQKDLIETKIKARNIVKSKI